MKKLKLAALLTAFTLSVTAFAACGKKDDAKNGGANSAWETSLKITDVYNTEFVGDKSDNISVTAKTLGDFTGWDKLQIENYENVQNKDVVQVFYKKNDATGATTYKLYNLALDKVVKTFDVENAVQESYLSSGNYVRFVFIRFEQSYATNYAYAVVKQVKDLATGTGTTETYALDGYELSKSQAVVFDGDKNIVFERIDDEDGNTDYYLTFSIFDADDKNFKAKYTENVYTGETKTAVRKEPVNEIKDFENDYVELGNVKLTYDSRGHINVYDKATEAFKFTFDLSAPSETTNIAIIGNGNILYQRIYCTDGSEYDYITVVGTKVLKHVLKSYVLNTSDGTETEVKLDYLCEDMENAVADEENFRACYKDSVENVARITRIIDKRVGVEQLAVVKNDLSVVGVIDKYVPDQNGEIVLVGKDLFKVYATGGRYYFIDKDGKIVGKEGDNVNYVSDAFAYTDNALYTLRTLDKLIDFKTDDYLASFHRNFGGNVIVKKEYKDSLKGSDYVLFKDNSSAPITMFNSKDVKSFEIFDKYYYVKTERVDEGGNTITHHVFKNTENEVIFEYDSDDNDIYLPDGGFSVGGKTIRIKTVNVRKSDGTTEKTYYRIVY